MQKLNVFIDGTWLLHQCGAGQCLSNMTDSPNQRFHIDFRKLLSTLMKHANSHGGQCDTVGDAYIATSIFSLPKDFDDWPNQYDVITSEDIERTSRAVALREEFIKSAVTAGFHDDAVFRPPIRDHIIRRLQDKRYQEKQVDTAIVALLVKYAITRSHDYHAIITGDSDLLPAIKVAYPEFTRNVFLISTHPDEVNAAHRQTAFSYLDFNFSIDPLFLEYKAVIEQIICGDYVHKCEECGKVFTLMRPLPKNSKPRCRMHRKSAAGTFPKCKVRPIT